MTFPAAPETNAAAPAPDAKPGPIGIGGWLILPLLGFIGTILLTGWNLVQALQSWSGLVAIFTATDGPLASIKLATGLSLIAGILVILSAAYCLYLMFAKKQSMVRFATMHYTILALGGLIDFWGGGVIEAALPSVEHDPSALKELIRGFVIAAIWIPYFNLSRRVRNTYTA